MKYYNLEIKLIFILMSFVFIIALSCGKRSSKEIDPVPPAGIISINKNAIYTDTTYVALTINAHDNKDNTTDLKMCISNTTTPSIWEQFKTFKSWDLIPGDGKKTVYIWFKDTKGNVSTEPFTDSILLDETPPLVVSVNPSHKTTDVKVTIDSISATFNEEINKSSIELILKQDANIIEGRTSYDTLSKTIKFAPINTLDYSSKTTAAITTKIKDLAGNFFTSDYIWEFKTESNNKPPVIINITPANNAANISLNTAITATFSEPMDTSTINISTIALYLDTLKISGILNMTNNNKNVTFTPLEFLKTKSTYRAIISKNVKDTEANNLGSDYIWNFTTVQEINIPPSMPTNVTAIADNGKITISWDIIEGATSYNIFWSNKSNVTTKTGTLISGIKNKSYTHSGLDNGTTYYYIITASNYFGESNPSSEIFAKPIGIPPAPANFKATPGDKKTTLTWNSVTDVLSYNIYWSTSSNVNKSTGTQILNATSPFIHTDRENGTIYYYVVTAVNIYGESVESFFSQAKPWTAPPAPINFLALSGNKNITLSWKSVADSWIYYIYWSLTPNVTKSTGIKIKYTYFGSLTDGKTFSYTHINLTNGTAYYYIITAENSYGIESAESIEVSGVTQGSLLNINPALLDFGGTNISKSIYITNSGKGSMYWYFTDYKSWLSMSPTSGNTTTEIDSTVVSINKNGLIRGSYSGTIYIDSDGGNTTIPVSMTVLNNKPIITSDPSTYIIFDSTYNYDVNATDLDEDIITYSLLSKPSGMDINTVTGLIQWKPTITDIGTYNITVSAGDSYGDSTMQNFSLYVINQPTLIGGAITSDTTWRKQKSPFIISNDNIVVNSSVTLTIEPGCIILLDNSKSIMINGKLVARGTNNNKIKFSKNSNKNWGYILFNAASTDATFDGNDNYIDGSILEYCTIEYAGGGNVSTNNGAVRMNDAHPFINYCSINNNSASGIRAWDLSTKLKVKNNTISNNVSSSGGGIYISPSYNNDSTIIIANNIISNNSVTGYDSGSGIFAYAVDSNNISILNNNINNNIGAGGIYAYSYYGEINISNNIIYNNNSKNSTRSAGGVFAKTGSNGIINILNNNISYNSTAYSYYNGGGIYAYTYNNYGKINISNNNINNNSSDEYGGGIYANTYDYYDTIKITNNIINNNIASYGGGIYAYTNSSNSRIEITNNIVKNNISSDNGGGIYAYYSSGDKIKISNNIINNNTTLNSGGGIYSTGAYVDILTNSIIKNFAKNSSAIYSINTDDIDQNIKYNTITENITTDNSDTYAINIKGNPQFNFNNIFNNNSIYELRNNNTDMSEINAQNNWWGTTFESEIKLKTYDYFDDSAIGSINFNPFNISKRTDAPISPPTNFSITSTGNSITLNWSENTESDVVGYKIYWGTVSGAPYENSVDVNNTTTYTIPNIIIGSYYVSITAYDSNSNNVTDDPNTIINEKQMNGNESQYSEEKSISIQ